jgi:UDP-N-acetyl-D-mannosaminuronate dehydrogenase
MEILRAEGACIEYHDPFVPSITLHPTLFSESELVTLNSVPLTPEGVSAADLVAILVGHAEIDYRMILDRARLVFDAVNATRGQAGNAVVERL